jgi:hypothetical protein
MDDFKLAIDMLKEIPLGWVVLAIANIPIYLLLLFTIIGDWEDIKEAGRFLLTPRLISIFRGEDVDDSWSTMKVFFVLLISVLTVVAEYFYIIPGIAPSLAEYLHSL